MLRSRYVAVLVLLLAGCQGSEPAKNPSNRQSFAGTKLVAGLIGGKDLLPGLRAQEGEWSASSGAQVEFREVKSGELDGVDVVIFAGEALGNLIDKSSLLPLQESMFLPPVPDKTDDSATKSESAAAETEPDAFNYRDVTPAYRDQAAKYGKDLYALPLGGTCIVFVFRRDVFENPSNIAAAKAAGIALEPPKTWEELDALAKFFHNRDWDGSGKPKSGIALAWGADTEGVANAIFLSRAAALGQHRDQYSFLFSDRMEDRITTPPFVEALEKLHALTKFGPADAKKFDAATARSAFRTGQVPLLIDRAESVTTWSEGKPVGTAALPGSLRIYNPDRKNWEIVSKPNAPAYLPHGGGWMIGVAAKSVHRDAAIDLTKYYAGPDATNRLRSDPTFPLLAIRNTHLGQGLANPRGAQGVEPRAWADAVSRTINAVRVVIGLRIPGAEGYLADLSRARLAALDGQPVPEALAKVSEAWDGRTKSVGTARQTWHYRRSLNNFVTAPQPPAPGN